MWVGLRQCVNTFSGEEGHRDIDMIWYHMGHREKNKTTSPIHHLHSYVLNYTHNTTQHNTLQLFSTHKISQ